MPCGFYPLERLIWIHGGSNPLRGARKKGNIMAPRLPGDEWDTCETRSRMNFRKRVAARRAREAAEKLKIRLEIHSKRGVRRPKFYPDDPDDCWDTVLRNTVSTPVYNPIGNFRDRRKTFDWTKLNPTREPEPERDLVFSLENIGRRIRNMSGKISIPVIPILVVMWIFDPFGFFEDDEKTTTVETKPAFSEKAVEPEKKTFKEEVVGVMDSIEKNVIPAAKEKWNQAKEELKSDEPDPIVTKSDEPDPIVTKSDDPYAQENKYESTTEY